MKTGFLSWVLSAASSALALGVGTDLVELDRGPHHRTWARVANLQTPAGIRPRTNVTVVELQGGLHRWDADQNRWVVSTPRIELFQDGALVRGLQYAVIFAPNLATPGAIDLQLPDGQRLTGHLLGLAYTEGTNSVLIAEVKDCAGEVSGPEQNTLTFPDAFTDYAIDVQYGVERDRFRQDLIVRERLRSPRDYGMTENAHLEVLTEWTAAPVPHKETRVVAPAADGQRALTDERISLGAMEFLTGRAFSIGAGAPSEETLTSKSWEQIPDQGSTRTFLIEKIPWGNIRSEIQKLPPPQASLWKSDRGAAKSQWANAGQAPPPIPAGPAFLSSNRSALQAALPPPRRAKRPTLRPIRLAAVEVQGSAFDVASSRFAARSSPRSTPAFCIDFELGLTTNFMRWKSDTTYYISGPITVTTNIFEGGCVIKYAPTNSAGLRINGPVTCLTSPYRPAILTARDDHSVGEAIWAGALSGYYASTALVVDNGAGATDLRHLRVAHANIALSYDYDTGHPHTVSHAQIIHCNWGAIPFNTVVRFRNVLMYDVQTSFSTSTYGCTSICENVTFHKAAKLADVPSGSLTFALTNCLLVAVTNLSTYSGSHNAVETSDAGVFQTVGAGSHYLAAGSTNRNAGTTNINPELLADLRQMTTYPPVVLSNTFVTVDTTLSPQAQRDTDLPDRGYHLSPVDYAICGLYVTNGTKLTIAPGTALGVFGAVNNTGLMLMDGAALVCEGTPLSLVQIALFNLIQEQATTNWSGSLPSYVFSTPFWSVSAAPQARFAFTRWSLPAGSIYQFYGWPDTSATLTFKDCQFLGGMVFVDRPSVLLTNCLIERTGLDFWDLSGTSDLALCNNTFHGGYLCPLHVADGSWVARDNLFDKTWIPDYGSTLTNDYNAYTFTNLGRLLPFGPNDVVLSSSNIAYQATALSRFYVPTNLATINAGSRNATNAGLYHYTCTTNQVAETNSVVDIGFHLVALNAQLSTLNLRDFDGDALANVAEDLDGNGVFDAGTAETDWKTYNSRMGIGTNGPGLVVFTPLK